MSAPSTGTATPPSALDLVFDSARSGWERMVALLFHGPHASIGGWVRWGLLLLLAGASAGGSGNFGGSWPGNSSSGWRSSPGDILGWSHQEFLLLVAILAPLFLLALLVWVYFMCRFRLVLVDAVVTGEPRLGGVYGRTAAGGLGLFVFELVVGLTCLVLVAAPIALFVVAVLASQRSVPVIVVGAVALVLVVLPMVLICSLAAWFSRSLLTPVVWRREGTFTQNLSHAWMLVRTNWAAVLLLAVAEFIATIASSIVAAVAMCATCCLWIWPAVVAVGMFIVTVRFIWTGFVLLPLALGVLFLLSWFFAALLAPISVFFRCWTYAFMERLDPELGGWATGPAAPVASGGSVASSGLIAPASEPAEPSPPTSTASN